MTINFVTSSTEKLSEARQVLPSLEQLAIDLPEIQENDPQQVIIAKLDQAQQYGHGPIIVEDTGLYLTGWNGFPGPLIKWALAKMQVEGLAKSILATGNPYARAITCLGYINESGEKIFCEGIVEGQIVLPRGKGFGWDAIFQPNGSKLTFGEMLPEEKQQYSMRRRAFEQLKLLL